MQSVRVYAADNNDVFPIVSYAPYSAVPTVPRAAAATTNVDHTLLACYHTPNAHPGSVQANQ